MKEELIDILGKSKLFSGFSLAQLEEVMLHLQPKTIELKDFEQVCKKGEPANSCWIIQSGNLMVKRKNLRSPFQRLIFQQGSVTGIQGLANPGSKRTVTMLADGKLNLVEINHAGMSKLDKDTQILLLKNISRLLLGKLTTCLSQISLND